MLSPVIFAEMIRLLLSFVVLWIGSGLLFRAIEKLSKRLHFSQFTLSLFLLGTATSFPEIAVLINSLLLKQPEVSMGNLVGGQVFLLFLVIPLLAIITRGIKLHAQMQGKFLVLLLAVIAAPLLTLVDGRVDFGEGVITLFLYCFFAVTFFRKMTLIERINVKLIKPVKINPWLEVAKVLVGVGLLFAATQVSITSITTISLKLELHPFLVSMVIMALGTNLPEFSLAMRAALNGKREIALGDYVGSAAMNTLLWAILIFSSRGTIYLNETVIPMVLLLGIGLVIFWWFCRTQKKLSVKEGLILMTVYLTFLAMTAWLEFGVLL